MVDRTPPRGSRMINGCPELTALLAMDHTILGAGTFGRVFRAGDYVVKEMELKSNTHADLFQKELEAWETLSKIPELADYIPTFCYGLIRPSSSIKGTGYLVHKYVPSLDLHSFLSERSFLPLNINLSYHLIKNIIKAFELLHKAGYVHRDIKPENILIRNPAYFSANDVVKPMIIDFGLVCKAPCMDWQYVGTKVYSPENWFPVDERPRGYVTSKNGKNIPIKVSDKRIQPFYDKTTEQYAIGKVIKHIYDRTNITNPKIGHAIEKILMSYMFGISAKQASIYGRHINRTKPIPINEPSSLIKQQFIENTPARLQREMEMRGEQPQETAGLDLLANTSAILDINNNSPLAGRTRRRSNNYRRMNNNNENIGRNKNNVRNNNTRNQKRAKINNGS